MEANTVPSAGPSWNSLTLFSSIGGGFSRAEGDGIRTLHDLLQAVQPLRLALYDGKDLLERSQVGEGGSYRVFRSSYGRGTAIVAVKQVKLPLETPQYDAFRKQVCCVLKDVEIMHHAPLAQHGNILNLLGYGWGLSNDGALPFLVTEYSTFGTLRQFLKNSPPRMRSRLELCGNVASGLHAMHLSGISHGDLKLENVLVFRGSLKRNKEEGFIAKLSDFGHSCLLSPEQACGSVQTYRGTVGYQAPELFLENRSSVDFRKCDIWALALLLWETLLGGSRYIEDQKIRELIDKINSCPQPTTISNVEMKGDATSNDKPGYSYFMISEELAPLAISFIDTALKEHMSDLERAFVKGILRTSLRTDPKHRCGDVSKLPFVHSKHEAGEHSQLVEKSIENDRWGFEVGFLVSIPNKAKIQMFEDAKRAALHPANATEAVSVPALYVAFAYATGFGVDRNMAEFRSWTERSAQNGSNAAKLVLDIVRDPKSSRETVLRGLMDSWCAVDNQSRQGSCQFQDDGRDAWSIESFRSTDGCNPLHFLSIFDSLAPENGAMATETRPSKILKRKTFEPLQESEFVETDYKLDNIVAYFGLSAVGESVVTPHYLYAQFPLSLCGSPLSFAVTLNCNEAIRSLLRQSADPLESPSHDSAQHTQVLPPLHTAISCLQMDIFRLLWSACQFQISAQDLRKKFIEDDVNGAFLISSIARRSVLEREILHGPHRASAQAQMITTLAGAMNDLARLPNVSHEEPPSQATFCLLGRLFCRSVQETLKLGDLEAASDLISQIPLNDLPDFESVFVRREIMETAFGMACGGVFDMDQSKNYLLFGRRLGDDLDPDTQALRAIIEQQNVGLFLYHLESGAQVNSRDESGQSPLHHMLTTGFYKLVPIKELLDRGADVTFGDDAGVTPLHLAATRGLLLEVQDILAKGADVCAVDEQGVTPLICSVLSGNEEVLAEVITAILVQQGIDLDSQNHSPELLLAYGNASLTTETYLKTALHHAAQKQDSRAVSILLTRGAPVDIPDDDGNLPLHLAIGSKESDLNDVLFCLHSLLEAGSPIDQQNDAGLTSIHLAALTWVGDALEAILLCFLTFNESSLDVKDLTGKSPLHHVAAIAQESSINVLLQLGASPDCLDYHGASVLHNFAQTSHRMMKDTPSRKAIRVQKSADLLMASGISLALQDEKGFTAIDYAVINGNVSLVDYLLGRWLESFDYSQPEIQIEWLQMLSSCWTLSIKGEHWAIVKRILPLVNEFGADMSLLSWPTGAHLFKYAVERGDTDLLRYFCPPKTDLLQNFHFIGVDAACSEEIRKLDLRPKFLYRRERRSLFDDLNLLFPNRSRQFLRDLVEKTSQSLLKRFFSTSVTKFECLPLALRRVHPSLTRGWLADELREFESYVKEQETFNNDDSLCQIYVYIASWDEDLIKSYFRNDFYMMALHFLRAWLTVEDVQQEYISELLSGIPTKPENELRGVDDESSGPVESAEQAGWLIINKEDLTADASPTLKTDELPSPTPEDRKSSSETEDVD